MSLVHFAPGVPDGAPDRVTFQVSAIGSIDAADQAKREARESGYLVRTMGRIALATGEEVTRSRMERRDWNVELVVRKKA